MTIHDDARLGEPLTETKLREYLSFDRNIINELNPENGIPPLTAAVLGGHVHTVELLLITGAEVNQRCKRGPTALEFAARNIRRNRAHIIHLLLRYHADVDSTCEHHANNTPLMIVIQEFRDVDAIKELVDAGASLNMKNDRGETAEDLARMTNEPKVIDAAQPRARRSSLSEATDHIVSLVRFTLSWANKRFNRGDFQSLYNWTIPVDQDLANIIETTEKDKKAEFLQKINIYVKNTGLERFFSPGNRFLQTVAEKAIELRDDPKTSLGNEENLPKMIELALYQPVLYCDDSGSMKLHGRMDAQRDLVARVAAITTRLVPDDEGVELRFINHHVDSPGLSTLKADEIRARLSEIKPSFKTKIGTSLDRKILKPLVYDVMDRGEELKRPLVISIITDGEPSEEASIFKDAIVKCGDRLAEKKYPRTAVMFHVSQIGKDPDAEKFLTSLSADPKLRDVVYVTSEKLDDRFREMKGNERHIEEWLLNTLMCPIMKRSVE